MEKTQARLREQIERHRAGKTQPNLRFPATLRREILQYAQEHRAGGEGVHAIAGVWFSGSPRARAIVTLSQDCATAQK